jgi:hypothetical protein
MMSLRQAAFTVIPAFVIYRMVKSQSTTVMALGTIGGGVAGYITSNILETMGGN